MTTEELKDEIDAINAIYPDTTTEMGPQIYTFKVPENEDLNVVLSFPTAYPDERPNIIDVSTDDSIKYSDMGYLERLFGQKLGEVYREGEVCIFEFLTELQEVLEREVLEREVLEKVEKLDLQQREQKQEKEGKRGGERDEYDELSDSFKIKSKNESKIKVNPLDGWSVSDPIIDRGSTFIGYAREVSSLSEAESFLDLLVTDKKISKSAHNMSAWRIKGQGRVQYQDCDDDGETAAGTRLLHLLTMMDVWNVIVVVARWFGGTHLGPDRFKHINSAGRHAVLNAGIIPNEKDKKKKK